MAENDKSKDPSSTSAAYDRMAPDWKLVSTLLGGTRAMRAARELYLPQHEKETAQGYNARIGRAVLKNFTEQTLDTLSGLPFTELPKIADYPTEFEPLLDDINLQGDSLHVFARQWFREAMAKGLAHVLVDFPKLDETKGPRTLADDRDEGVRPYWVMIRPENLIYARTEVVQGRERVAHLRIMESYTESDGFTDVERRRIRVLEPGSVQLFVETEKGEWRPDDAWETGLDEVPLVTFYANRIGPFEAKSPLLDLAHLNVAHWQSSSDQDHILTVTRFPMLAVSGATEAESEVAIGPQRLLFTPDPHGKYYYVEHTGASIAAGAKDLADKEAAMAVYGAEFLVTRPGTQTATARALDSAEATSDLQAMSQLFDDAVEQALYFTAKWLGLDKWGSFSLHKRFQEHATAHLTLPILQELRAKGEISRKVLLQEMKRRKLLPDDYDVDGDADQIVAEAGQRVSFDLDPSAGDPPKK